MNDLNFILKVLKISSENDLDISWYFEDEKLIFTVDCSDVFNWATADCEDITEENFPVLEQAVKDINSTGSIHTHLASQLFCARVRKQRPQGAFYSIIDKKVWHLFDECGEVREVGFLNPYAPGEYKQGE